MNDIRAEDGGADRAGKLRGIEQPARKSRRIQTEVAGSYRWMDLVRPDRALRTRAGGACGVGRDRVHPVATPLEFA
jgi:hypothetical protein